MPTNDTTCAKVKSSATKAMFKKVQSNVSRTGDQFKSKAKDCKQWLIEPDLEYRGTVCLSTTKYSRKLWEIVKSKAQKHQQELTKDTAIKLPPSLMMLPRELRQKILLDTYDLNNYRNLKPLHFNRFHDFMYLRAQHVGTWVLNLRKVHPEIDLDMDYVNKTWAAQLDKVQALLRDEFNYVWDNILFENRDWLTAQQIVWRHQYREMFAEMGFLAHKLWWEVNHPILKYVRKVPGLRRRIGVDTRSKMVWRRTHGYLDVAWHIMNGGPDDEDLWSDSSSF